jgi:hypothetical protein
MHKLNKSFGGGWQHELFYKGELDLTGAEGTDESITVNIMEGGLSKYLSANENTEYELDIDVPEARYVEHDGIELKQKASYLVTNGALPNDLGGATLSLQLLGNEGVNQISATTQQRVKTGNTVGDIWNANSWFLTTGNSATDIKLNWNFNVFMQLASGVGGINPTSVFLHMYTLQDSSTRQVTVLQQLPITDPILLYNHKHNFSGSLTTTIPANSKCVLYLTANQNRDLTFWTYDNDGEFTIDYNYRHRVTYPKALPPMYVAQKLLDKMTGGGYQFTSNFIANNWNNLLITSGDALRGIQGAKLKTSWRSFYDSYNSVCNLAGGIRNQILTVEQKSNAYQSTLQLDLLDVNDFKDVVASEYLYNVFKFGYPNTDTRDVNGRDEFNVTVTYTTAVTKVSKTYDMVSKYMASMYEIESIRINLDGKTTTDGENDNTVFFLHTETTQRAGGVGQPAVYYRLLRNVYDSITGLISPSTAYNLELHPELCMRRHGNFIRGSLFWLDGTDIVRETSDKNDRVVVIKNGLTYIGNKNTRVGTLDPALFVPIMFTVEGLMPAGTIDILENAPNGTFGFNYKGKRYYGFPLECSIQPVDRPAQETIMLCSPLTDLNNIRLR